MVGFEGTLKLKTQIKILSPVSKLPSVFKSVQLVLHDGKMLFLDMEMKQAFKFLFSGSTFATLMDCCSIAS